MKKLISVLLAVCMVFSMITVSAVSAGAAAVGKGANTGASGKTIYVGVVEYLKLTESNYQVHYWGGAETGDASLTLARIFFRRAYLIPDQPDDELRGELEQEKRRKLMAEVYRRFRAQSEVSYPNGPVRAN